MKHLLWIIPISCKPYSHKISCPPQLHYCHAAKEAHAEHVLHHIVSRQTYFTRSELVSSTTFPVVTYMREQHTFSPNCLHILMNISSSNANLSSLTLDTLLQRQSNTDTKVEKKVRMAGSVKDVKNIQTCYASIQTLANSVLLYYKVYCNIYWKLTSLLINKWFSNK